MAKTATIYHNTRCGTSRKVLSLLEDADYDIEIVEYLKTPPDAATLRQLITDAGVGVRDAVRTKEAEYKELGLDRPDVTDDELITAMTEHPALIQRPFVVTEKGTRLARPVEVAEEVL
ncbi:arsenate reductase (glutaredoxin) [Streptomyces smyrnaeus]|uniref:arsenate reductase (glutaredoxin) n=1 Tax=Streptomyces TaxID=1883 RepID=UPI000C185463|nr:arsenate reductase (glutaredoxin) [Streptomyces sp. B15]MBQ1118688.1 arsenate reductase (glutaredoxin) [Streptomyces sp. B15]MBQ1157192.1 arsenate reductase (glutaredoxin) [Streptomyces sp. A73]